MQLNIPPMFDRDPFAHHYDLKDVTAPRDTAGIALFGMDMNEANSSDQEEDNRTSRKVIYTCAFPGCDGVFNSTSNKKRHEKLHSGEKPHRCDYSGCGKSFARKYDLKVHVRTHTKEKPYTCEVMGCAKKFSRNSSLREHERNIHNLAVGQKYKAGRGEPRRHLCATESKPRERSESKRYEKDSKMYLPLDGQSKAQVQELVNLFKASQQQGDSKSAGSFEVRTMLPRELVTNLLDIKRERTATKCSEPKMEDGNPFQNLPPLAHHLYSSYPSGTEVIPSASFSFLPSGQGNECQRHHQGMEDAEGEHGLWQMHDLWSIPH